MVDKVSSRVVPSAKVDLHLMVGLEGECLPSKPETVVFAVSVKSQLAYFFMAFRTRTYKKWFWAYSVVKALPD